MDSKMKCVSNFNERFKEAFGDRSLTDFAAEIGLSKQTISAYLNGSRKPKRPGTEIIARKLGVSPSWLCGFDVPKYIEREPTADENKADVALSEDTKELIGLYEELSSEEKKILLSTARAFKAKK